MDAKDDSVFQVSLTEIAFTLVLLMLLEDVMNFVS